VLDPRDRPVDVEITVCVEAGHIPSEVRDRVLRRIRGDAERPGLYDAPVRGSPVLFMWAGSGPELPLDATEILSAKVVGGGGPGVISCNEGYGVTGHCRGCCARPCCVYLAFNVVMFIFVS